MEHRFVFCVCQGLAVQAKKVKFVNYYYICQQNIWPSTPANLKTSMQQLTHTKIIAGHKIIWKQKSILTREIDFPVKKEV